MRIKAVVEKTLKVDSAVRNARVDLSQMTVTVLALVTDVIEAGRPIVGYAFNSFGRYGCGGPLRDRFIPRLLAADPVALLDETGRNFDPPRIQATLLAREKSGGHAERSMALGTLDMALWDIVAKLERRPLYQTLSRRFAQASPVSPGPVQSIPTYAAGGYYAEGDGVQAIADETQRWRDLGFIDMKIKAGGADLGLDLSRIEAALGSLGPKGRLALDLSCAFTGDSAFEFARTVQAYGLWWLEEPCDPLDYRGYHEVGQAGLSLAFGENLFHAKEFDHCLTYADFACPVILQPDPPLAYGVSGMLDVIAVAQCHGLGRDALYPHGGNMMALQVAAGLGLAAVEAYPNQFGIFGGFSDEAVIAEGRVRLPTAPGIGFEDQRLLYPVLADLVADAA